MLMETQLADRAFNFFIMQLNEMHKHTFALFVSTKYVFFLNTEKVFQLSRRWLEELSAISFY